MLQKCFSLKINANLTSDGAERRDVKTTNYYRELPIFVQFKKQV